MLPKQENLWTRSFIALTIGYFLLFLSLHMLLSPLPGYVKERFQPDNVTISLLTTMFAVSAIAARFMAAYAMKVMHRNVVLMAGLALAAVAIFAYPYATSIPTLLILRAAHGIGFGWASTVVPTMVSQIIPVRRMGEGIGYFGYSTSLAMSVGPALGIQLLEQSGIHVLSELGACAAAVIIPLLLFSRGIPAQPTKKASPDAGGAGSGRMNSMTLLPAALNALLSLIYGGLLGFLGLYGQEIGIPQIGLFFLVSVISIVAVRPIAGRIFDRRGHMAVLIPASFAVMGSMLLLSYAHNLTLVLASALLFGAGFGAIQLTTQAWMLRLAEPRHHGAANSLYYNSIDLGVGAGSLLLGAVAGAAGYAGMYRISAGFMVLFLLAYSAGLLAERKARLRHHANEHVVESV
ncbi:MFS transporter [Cohnella candidum]|nr:MFS transporter [Cohnella candidum]